MTRNLISIVLFFFLTNILYSQYDQSPESGFHIDTIHLDDYTIVPKVKALDTPNSCIESKINSSILALYGMNSWDNTSGGRWASYTRTLNGFKIEKEILMLSFRDFNRGFSGIRRVFISLKNGETISPVQIPLSSLVRTDQYLNFIRKNWIEDVKPLISDRYKCCEVEKTQRDIELYSYDIDEFSIQNDSMRLAYKREGPTTPCFGACYTYFEKMIPLEKINPILNDFGKKIIEENVYQLETNLFAESSSDQTSIDQIIYSNNIEENAPENLFIIGQIEGKYPFRMSLNIDNSKNDVKVTGIYSYDSQEKEIQLIGFKNGDYYEINEYYNGKMTGQFTIKAQDYYWNWQMNWTDKDQSKILEVEVDKVFH